MYKPNVKKEAETFLRMSMKKYFGENKIIYVV